MSNYSPFQTNKSITFTNGYMTTYTSPPDLASVSSLTELQGKLTCIHAAALFHLFDEPTQLSLAHRISTLLSPVPGSFIFGSHGGLQTKGFRDATGGIKPMFCHSDVSWKEMWDGEVFEKGTVKVEATVEDWDREHKGLVKTEGKKFWQLVWKVTRL